jgi:hypothetical protein
MAGASLADDKVLKHWHLDELGEHVGDVGMVGIDVSQRWLELEVEASLRTLELIVLQWGKKFGAGGELYIVKHKKSYVSINKNIHIFVQLGLNEADTFKSSSTLIY